MRISFAEIEVELCNIPCLSDMLEEEEEERRKKAGRLFFSKCGPHFYQMIHIAKLKIMPVLPVYSLGSDNQA